MFDAMKALAPIEQQFLHELRDTGWNDDDLKNLAKAWNVAKKDIDAVVGSDEPDDHDVEIRTAIIAAQISHAIMTRCRVSTPAITSATPEQLLEWIDFYYAEATRLYQAAIDAQLYHPRGQSHGNPAFDQAMSQFNRICGFLWECNEHAGVNRLMQQVSA